MLYWCFTGALLVLLRSCFSPRTAARGQRTALSLLALLVLYWYSVTGTQFACFPGTKVQILTQQRPPEAQRRRALADETSAKIEAAQERLEVLSYLLALLVQKYLLYWYKSTRFNSTTPRGAQLLALLVQKCLLH